MHIVTVVDPNLGHYAEMRGATARVFTCANKDPGESNDYARALRQVDTWYVTNEEEVPMVVEFLATNNVGVDVHVFELKSVSVRAPGEIKHKQISKDGILPT